MLLCCGVECDSTFYPYSLLCLFNLSCCYCVLVSCLFLSFAVLAVLICFVVCWRGLVCVCSGVFYVFGLGSCAPDVFLLCLFVLFCFIVVCCLSLCLLCDYSFLLFLLKCCYVVVLSVTPLFLLIHVCVCLTCSVVVVSCFLVYFFRLLCLLC